MIEKSEEYEVLNLIGAELIPAGLELMQLDQYFAMIQDGEKFERDKQSGKIHISKKILYDGTPFDIISGPLAVLKIEKPENFCLLKVY